MTDVTIAVTEQNKKQYLARIVGRIDADNAYVVQNRLMQLVGYANSITINCKDLSYVSSAGLRTFLMVQKSMKNKNKLNFINVSDDVREVFRVTGFDQIMELPTII